MRKEQQRENIFVFVVRCLQWTTIIERTFTASTYEDRLVEIINFIITFCVAHRLVVSRPTWNKMLKVIAVF